jgi:L-glutamine-phosphate cytidylyltransferase
MKFIILAAGKGSRLGDPQIPKPLTKLVTGQSILELQLEQIATLFSLDDVILVVGYHKEMIMDQFPELLYVYSPSYASENTSQSLLKGLRKVKEDVVWINGDVVFHPSILPSILAMDQTCMLTNIGKVGEEEVKYRTDEHGKILEVSKHVAMPQGEALGLNFFKEKDLDALKEELAGCQPQDYFEKGIERAIENGLNVQSCPVKNPTYCTEIDFPEDLERANLYISSWI